MRASILSLFDSVVDYAGTFPPTRLDLSVALDEYVRHQTGPDSWILGRFVCDAKDLPQLASLVDRLKGDVEIPVSVIGQPNESVAEWRVALEQDSVAMNGFIKSADTRTWIEAYEVRVPSNADAERCLRDLGAFEEVDVFVELPWGEGMMDSVAAVAQTDWVAAKARIDGDGIAESPTPFELAEFIHSTVGLDLSFKLASGLQMPLSRILRETGAQVFGYLNVVAACGYAYAHDMARAELEQILLTSSIEDWDFEEKSLTWRNLSLTLDDIEDSRDLLWSIGSPSIQEVLGGLQTLTLVSGGN